MNIVNNLFLKKFLIVFLVVIMLLNFLVPTRVYAWDLGGVLLKPITALITLAIDAINSAFSLVFKGPGMVMDDDGNLSGTNILLSPEEIFKGEIGILNANIFSASVENNIFVGGKITNLAGALKTAISGIYEMLRNFCAIVMLCMLIYTGIRIVLASASASEKKEWKMRLMDWLKALLLLVFIHVIMISIFYVSEIIMKAMQNSDGLNISSQLRSASYASFTLMEQIVIIIMYGYTTYLTMVFVLAYAKRLFWIAILIVVAPIVAIMYCFGKNGKSIFDKWFKEYTLSVLIQPYHFIVYYVLVMIPLRLATTAGGSDTLLPDLTGRYGSTSYIHFLFNGYFLY